MSRRRTPGRLPAAFRFLIFCACLFPAPQAFAHEVRPAYLDLREEAPGTLRCALQDSDARRRPPGT